MAESNIKIYENTQQDGQPMECFRFVFGDMVYGMTSNRFGVSIVITKDGNTRTETYTADYIKRSSIKPSSQGSDATVKINVSKDNVVAALFKASPPDKPVTLEVIRLHEQDHTKFDVVLTGEVTQAAFQNSECVLTVSVENWLSRKFPHFMRQFFCCNVIYDESCMLSEQDYEKYIYVDKVVGLTLYSANLEGYEDNYFAGGVLKYDGNSRMISGSKGNTLFLRYPFPTAPMGYVKVYPGCDKRFTTCARRFSNTINFSGFPYVPPEFSGDNKVGNGVYWVDSSVIKRDTDGYVGQISL